MQHSTCWCSWKPFWSLAHHSNVHSDSATHQSTAYHSKKIKLLEAQPQPDHALCVARRRITHSLQNSDLVELQRAKLVRHDKQRMVSSLPEPKCCGRLTVPFHDQCASPLPARDDGDWSPSAAHDEQITCTSPLLYVCLAPCPRSYPDGVGIPPLYNQIPITFLHDIYRIGNETSKDLSSHNHQGSLSWTR
jgi:hypothetical protein